MADEQSQPSEEGQLYTIKTSRGDFKARLNREPTNDEAMSLAEKYFNETTPSEADVKGDVAARRARMTETPRESAAKAPHGGAGVDMLLEGAMPAGAQAMASEMGPGGVAAVGGITSALGNTLAQFRRMAAGDQPDGFSGGQLASAAAIGSVPVAGPEMNLARASKPIIRGLVRGGVEAAKMGLVGAAGEQIKIAIDEGRPITVGEGARAAMLPAVLGGFASGVGSAGESMASKGARVRENSRDYTDIGSKPTVGMMLPEDFARTEKQIARSDPTGKVAGQIDAVKSDVASGMQNVAPNPQEGAEIFKSASPLLRQVSTAEDEVAKLNKVAVKANADAETAFQKLGEAKDAGTADVVKTVTGEAERLSGEAFNANLNSALENARELATSQTTLGVAGVDPATGRDLWVEHVAKPVLGAFETHSAQLYSTVDNKVAGFDAAPILSYAKQLASDVTGGLPKKLESSLNLIADNLGANEGGKVSLQALRNARSELLRKVKLGELDSNNEERLIKGITSEITRQIDSQAISALGEEGGKALKAANLFYREGKELFDQVGVDALFASKPNDESIRKVISGMEKSGINADEYKNVQKLIERIGQDVPGLADSAQGHVNDIIKKSIIYDASRVNPASAAGELKVDGEALLKKLSSLAKVPGTLEQLVLGSPAKVAELEKLFVNYPQASAMTSDQWNQILSSPTFRGQAGESLASQLGPIMADSQVNNQLVTAANLRAAGRASQAQKVFDDALTTLRSVDGDVTAARNKYEELLKDPVAIAFNNPNLGAEGFNSLAKSLFDPKASKVTNSEVTSMVDALKNSKTPANQDLLLRLQERYIADKVATYHSTPVDSMMLKQSDSNAVALFFNPINPGDATNEIARARALLTTEQFNQLSAFAKTAKSIGQYEKLGVIPEKSGSYNIPVVGQIRRGVDAVADFYRSGKYNIASKLLADPQKFSNVALQAGEAAQESSEMLKKFGLGEGRSQSNRR